MKNSKEFEDAKKIVGLTSKITHGINPYDKKAKTKALKKKKTRFEKDDARRVNENKHHFLSSEGKKQDRDDDNRTFREYGG